MKLQELAFVVGDDGGMHASVNKAMSNMEKHAKSHPDAKTRDACSDAVKALKVLRQRPTSMFDDPHTVHKLLSHMHGEPKAHFVRGAASTLNTYTPGDSD